MMRKRPHVLGIDDGSFNKKQDAEVPVVGVVMEGATVVEGVAVTSFPVDGGEVTEFLARWIAGLKWCPMLHAVVFGGITIAGLAVIDLERLSRLLELPVVAATRRDTAGSDVDQALRAAGLEERLSVVQRSPAAWRLKDGLYVAAAGGKRNKVNQVVRATLNKALLPEPLRVAHLIGAALGQGASRGKV